MPKQEHSVSVRPYSRIDFTTPLAKPLVEPRLEVNCTCGWARDCGAGDMAIGHLMAVAREHSSGIRLIGGSDVA